MSDISGKLNNQNFEYEVELNSILQENTDFNQVGYLPYLPEPEVDDTEVEALTDKPAQ